MEVIKPSEFRVTAPCKVFKRCGGCDWQHVRYDVQFETKKKGVIHAMKRLGLEYDIQKVESIPSQNPYGYRNRVQLRGDAKKKKLGFLEKGSRNIIDVDRCEVADARINRALPQLRDEGFQDKGNPFSGEFKVEVEVTPEGEIRNAWNEKHAAFGFRQINDQQNEKLLAWVNENAGSGELLLDLFGGHGNLSIPLGSRFSEIHCVDTSTPDARPLNLPENYQFHKSDVLRWLQFKTLSSKKTATVIIDPPREGLGKTFPDFWQELNHKYAPKRILLISCDVDAFASDCSRFVKEGYKIEKMAALDLFPQTPHLESLALLTL